MEVIVIKKLGRFLKRNIEFVTILSFTLLLTEIKVNLDLPSNVIEKPKGPVRNREAEVKYNGSLSDLQPDPFFRKWSQQSCRSCLVKDPPFILTPDGRCQGHDLYVLFLINSHHKNIEKRRAIRETWGQRSVMSRLSMDYVFIFGVSKDFSDNLLIKEEDRIFHDIVQADFVEQYTNLNVKTLTGLKWMITRCQSETKIVIKTDDDIFMNVYGLHQAVTSRKLSPGNAIYGNCMSSGYPHRCPFSKWYAPYRFYPYRFYGYFCLGSAFIMSQEAAKELYVSTRNVPFFHVEDVFISALGGAAAGLSRKQYPGIYMHEVAMATCATNSSVLASLLSDSSGFYKLWQQVNMDKCMEDIDVEL